MTTPETQSNYWLDLAAEQITARYPEGEITLSSGISPSASYHIGHFREVMTAEALTWAVRQRGRKARHIHIVDNFDPLRSWYDFLPATDTDYAGHPYALIPDPYGDCHPSFADHFYAEFASTLPKMGIGGEGFEIIKSYEDLYHPDHMTAYIEKSLSATPEIKRIFKDDFKRELPEDWSPVLVLGEDGRFGKGAYSTWDKDKQTINGRDYTQGRAKLDWRLDWPARWAYLGVQVEPFGFQEHGAAGGSYDTGKQFAKQIFGVEAPYGEVQYGHIHRPGENIKMSSSKNNVVTPDQALEIMPPELLRYFMVRSRPEKKLFFDSGVGLYNLIDEFAAAGADPDHEFRDAYNFAVDGEAKQIISTVSFKHLVQVYQAAQGDPEETLAILSRTGHAEQVKAERETILAELPFVKNWLAKFAPPEVVFEVQKKLPKSELSDGQTGFLAALAKSIEAHSGEIDGQAMHELIYAAKDEVEISPKEAFQALYRVILAKDYGPKAGWFLASLDRDWLVARLHQTA